MNYFIILMHDEENERFGTTDILEENEMYEAVAEIKDCGYKYCVIDVKAAIDFKKDYNIDWKKMRGEYE